MTTYRTATKEQIIECIQLHSGIKHKELAERLRCSVNMLSHYMRPILESGVVTKASKYSGYMISSEARNRSIANKAFNIARKSA